MNKLVIILLSIIMLTGCTSQIEDYKLLDTEQWIEDIDLLDTRIKANHKDLYRNISKEEWDKSIDNLKKEVPKLSDLEIRFRISQILSSIKDGHTLINIYNLLAQGEQDYIENDELVVFPLSIAWLDNRMTIIACDEKYEDIIGTRLVSINNISVNEIHNKLLSLVFYDNYQGADDMIRSYIIIYDVLRYLEIVDDKNVVFEFENDNKEKITKEIMAKSRKEANLISLTDKIAKTSSRPEEFSQYYWYKYFKEDKIMYFQQNSLYTNTSKLISEENRKVYPDYFEFEKEFIKENNNTEYEKLVIDLRYNSGGSLNLVDIVTNTLKQEIDIKKHKVFVLIGKRTLSAGVVLAYKLKMDIGAIVVGEESGGNLNLFSIYPERDYLHLPNSNLIIQYSSGIETFDESIKRGLKPDIEIIQSLESYIEGIDDVYEYVVNW